MKKVTQDKDRFLQIGDETITIVSDVPLPNSVPSPLPRMQVGDSFAITRTERNSRWIAGIVAREREASRKTGDDRRFTYRTGKDTIRLWRCS